MNGWELIDALKALPSKALDFEVVSGFDAFCTVPWDGRLIQHDGQIVLGSAGWEAEA